MEFEWGARKAAANLRKHGVSFEDAASAMKDSFAATARDLQHAEGEMRFITFGLSVSGQLLAVSHTERGNVIRIISARLATKHERRIYEES